MIIRILVSLFLGLVGSLLVLERDPAIKDFLGNYCIQMFESAMHCHMKCKIARIDLLKRTIELENVDVTPKEQDKDAWHWQCQHYQIKISPWTLLTRQVVSMDISLEDINATSQFENNSLAIMPHLTLLVSFSEVAALELKSLSLRRVQLSAHDNRSGHHIDIAFNSDSNALKNTFRTVFNWIHGTITYAHRTLCDDLQGSINCDLLSNSVNLKNSIIAQVDCSCLLPQLAGSCKRCYIRGNYDQGVAIAAIKSDDELLSIGPLKIKFTQQGIIGQAVVHVPLSYVGSLMSNSRQDSEFSGHCMARVHAIYNDAGLSLMGGCGISDLRYGKIKLASQIITTFSHAQDLWSGHIKYTRDQLVIGGAWQLNPKSYAGTFDLHNSNAIRTEIMPHLYIEPHKINVKGTIHNKNQVKVEYKTTISSNKTERQNTVAGTLEANLNGLSIAGSYDNYTYSLSGTYNPCIRLQHFAIKNDKQETLIEIRGSGLACNACQGSIKLDSVLPIIKDLTNIELQGQGNLKVFGIFEPNLVKFKTKLEHGTVRIPHTYMCLTGFDSLASIDLLHKTLMVHYARADLYEGSLICRRASLHFDDKWHMSYTQIPLIIKQCLFNVRKDLFGVLSGNLLVTKNVDYPPHVTGIVLIDRAQLTENLFSGVLHDAVNKSTKGISMAKSLEATCDLELLTYTPIRINTVFLDCEARLNMHIKGDIQDPAIAGEVSLASGKLIFPYRPLNITKANIRLSPGAMTDPLIDIVAKNRIKKYMVSLQVAGSLQNHQIVLSSTPPLSTEQIIALLLIGSEEESLGTMVPALVMQNIKPLIFGSQQTKFLGKYFNLFLKPLQYIHFVPSFADQTGRGGLRGTLEIDLNDRWRAMIQNNFNLSEDTRFEVEYMLSDDISLKGGHDEHRDITGEVEMRWKFQ